MPDAGRGGAVIVGIGVRVTGEGGDIIASGCGVEDAGPPIPAHGVIGTGERSHEHEAEAITIELTSRDPLNHDPLPTF